MGRHLPTAAGLVWAAGTSIYDINWSAVAGGITVVATAGGLAYLQFAQKRLQVATAEAEARTRLEQEEAAARIKIQKEEAAAKLAIFRESELARIEIQRQQDEVNKGSLSARLESMTGQLIAIQRSADEANRSLEDARQFNLSLQVQLTEARQRIEDLNRKSHDLLNEQNVRNLKHEAEKMELQEKYDALLAKLEQAERRGLEVIGHVVEKVEDTQALASRNSALIRELGPPAPGAA